MLCFKLLTVTRDSKRTWVFIPKQDGSGLH